MTITYQLDGHRGVIVERWEGFISVEILRQHWQDLYGTDEYQVFDKTLVLLQEAVAGFQVGDLLPIVGTMVAPYRKASRRWNAIVVATPEQEYLAGVYTWNYTGTKVTTVNTTAKTASIVVPTGQPFSVAFTHATDTTKNKTWAYVPNLQADWSSANATKFWGTYTFQQTSPLGDTLTATIPQLTPLTWASACTFPISGVLTLSLPPASAEIRFDTSITDTSVQQACGVATINGYKLTLGQ